MKKEWEAHGTLGGYARERSLIKSTVSHSPFSCRLHVSLDARFITSSSSHTRGRQAEKAPEYHLRLHQPTMSQQAYIWRCKRQYIFLQQFTLVGRQRARDINSSRRLVSELHLRYSRPQLKTSDDCPNSLEKRDIRERSFPREKSSQCAHSIPSRTERACSSPKHITHRSCVSSGVRKADTDRHTSWSVLNRHNYSHFRNKVPWRRKEDDVFHSPFMPADAHLLTS